MIPANKVYIIGETAFHHQGELEYLKRLINAASELKLNAIKFHLLFDVEDYFVSNHPAVDSIKQWIFTVEQWEEVLLYAHRKNLDIIALCNDVASLNWINKDCRVPIKAVEIHATGINDIFLLDAASHFKNTVMLGIGGSTLDQIKYAVEILQRQNKLDIFLMYGFQNYPTEYKDINFSKIEVVRNLFNLPVGYADHTDPKDHNNEVITCSAILKGVNVIEKHFTLDVDEKRIDSQAAVSLEQMKNVIELSEIMYIANGLGGIDMSVAEKQYGDIGPMKKAIVARRNIKKGDIIQVEDLAYKRTPISSYLAQHSLEYLIGMEAKENIMLDEIIDYSNVEYKFKIAETAQFFNNK